MMRNGIEVITHHGKPYVAMPKATYDKLMEALEDAEDVAALEEAARVLAAGEEETLPAAMVYALGDAQHSGERLAIWRQHRGLSRVALGEAIDKSGQYIGMVESGRRKGDISLFRDLAGALGCEVSDLLA